MRSNYLRGERYAPILPLKVPCKQRKKIRGQNVVDNPNIIASMHQHQYRSTDPNQSLAVVVTKPSAREIGHGTGRATRTGLAYRLPRVRVWVGDSVPHENPYPSHGLRVGFDAHSNSARNGVNAFRSGFLCHLSLLLHFYSSFSSVSTFLCQQPPLLPIPLSPQHLKAAVDRAGRVSGKV